MQNSLEREKESFHKIMFRVGDRVKVIKAGRSEASRLLIGLIGTVTKVYSHCVSLDIEMGLRNNGGLWLDEIELIEPESEGHNIKEILEQKYNLMYLSRK